MTRKTPWLVILVALSWGVLQTACAPAAEEADVGTGALGSAALERVVIARMYQRDGWVISAVDPAVDRERAARYVCDAIAPLHPTYVSGLIRLEARDTISEEQVDMFRRVRHCIESRRNPRRTPRPVRFDVVLNALDYTDGTPEADRCRGGDPTRLSADEQTRLLRARRRSIEEQLRPDGYFFDFYSQPWVQDDRQGGPYRPLVLENEIVRMHRDGLFVGGNVWGGNVPPGSDYVAITDKSGRRGVIEQTRRLRDQGVPVLLHIRNDPHVPGSGGRAWNERDREYRMRILRRHVRWAEAAHASYMMPVFFPLTPNTDPAELAIPFCDRPHPWVAYDATTDRGMIERMGEYFDGGDRAAHLRSASGEDARPRGLDVEDDGPVPVHRAARYEAGQHLYTVSELEILDSPALTMEVEEYFGLAPMGGFGAAPLHRCSLGGGDHSLVTERCRAGVDEGALGFVATGPMDEMVPLYELVRPASSGVRADHFYTTSVVERDGAAIYGLRATGIVGWVYDTASLAVAEMPAAEASTVISTVHRGVNEHTGQHLYSLSLDELESGPGILIEGERFGLARDQVAGTVPFHRCYLGNGWHLQTVSATCEDVPGAIDEGVLGHIATRHLTGTMALHRMFRGGERPDHFYSTDAYAIAYAVSIGYADEGIIGFVYDVE